MTYIQGVPGLGTTLSFTPDGGSLTAVAQLRSVEPPALEAGTWESTALGSTWEEFLPTLLKGGEVGFEVGFDLGISSHAAITTAMFAKKSCDVTVTFPAAIGPGITGTTSHTVGCKVYITGFTITGVDKENYLVAQVKMKVTGAVTLT
ncbi:MAG TPA: hypothetical protein VG713_18970 [Pirellulales bacterium]|nr:hypothetical protein [Pirellulales bacterium]